MRSTDIFNHIRPKLGVTQTQINALYKILEKVDINLVAEFVGMEVEETEQVEKVEQSNYSLSKKSQDRLQGVNKNLVKVVERAIQITEQDFFVVEGVRSKEQAYINYGKGRTVAELAAKGVPTKYAKPKEAKVTWLNNPLNSKHIKGNAVDLAPHPLDWNDLSKFKAIGEAMKLAAKELNIKIEWGGDWSKKDYPHFEV